MKIVYYIDVGVLLYNDIYDILLNVSFKTR